MLLTGRWKGQQSSFGRLPSRGLPLTNDCHPYTAQLAGHLKGKSRPAKGLGKSNKCYIIVFIQTPVYSSTHRPEPTEKRGENYRSKHLLTHLTHSLSHLTHNLQTCSFNTARSWMQPIETTKFLARTVPVVGCHPSVHYCCFVLGCCSIYDRTRHNSTQQQSDGWPRKRLTMTLLVWNSPPKWFHASDGRTRLGRARELDESTVNLNDNIVSCPFSPTPFWPD